MEILDDFVKVREEFYSKRKEFELKSLQKNLDVTKNKREFCSRVINKKLDIFGKSKEQISSELIKQKFVPFSSSDNITPSFDYLLQIPMDAFSKERILSLEKDFQSKTAKLNQLLALSVKDLWLNDLGEIKTHYLTEATK